MSNTWRGDLDILEKMVRKYDIKAAIHNHGHYRGVMDSL